MTGEQIVLAALSGVVALLTAAFWRWVDAVNKRAEDAHAAGEELSRRLAVIEGHCKVQQQAPIEPRIIKVEERMLRLDDVLGDLGEIKSDLKLLSRAVDKLEATIVLLRKD